MEGIKFHRKDVAKILNVTTATIKNREDGGIYPKPSRDLNNYRIYDLSDIFKLQLISYGKIDPRPIISTLYDKGYKDQKEISRVIDKVLSTQSGVSVGETKRSE